MLNIERFTHVSYDYKNISITSSSSLNANDVRDYGSIKLLKMQVQIKNSNIKYPSALTFITTKMYLE